MKMRWGWISLSIQVVYVVIALSVALILWTFLPEVNEAVFGIGPFRGGGAFAGFAFVWWFLHKTGPKQAAFEYVQASIILTPSKKEQYNRLFDGFTNCDFYAFNPPFKLEGEPKDRLFEEALATHEKRYREGGVRSRYLFFDKPSYDRAQIFFQRLESRLGKEKLEESIKIRIWENAPEKPDYTFFIGHKGKGKERKPHCIFYPSAAMKVGLPVAIIYVEGAEDFLGILRIHFEEKWDQATENSG